VDRQALAAYLRDARPSLADEEREIGRRPPGTAYLARKRLEQALEWEGNQILAALARDAHERLAALSVDARLTRRGRRRAYFDAAYLVARGEDGLFHAGVADICNDHAGAGLTYELTGPWPPYSFVSDEETSG